MYEPFETYEHAGCVVKLYQDYDAGNPYKEWDQPSKLLYEGGYDFGSEAPPKLGAWYREDPSSAAMCRWLTLFGGYVMALPFHLADYGSGGLRAWITDPDGDPASGYVVMTAQDKEKIGVPDGMEEQAARDDFSVFNAYLEGDVIGYVVEDAEGEHVDSCWGFYCAPDREKELDYVRSEANTAAESHEHERLVNQEPTDIAEIIGTVARSAE